MSYSDKLHCHRCWTGERRDLDHNWHGYACPKCPEYRDDDASLSVVEKHPERKVNSEGMVRARNHLLSGKMY